MEVNGIIWCKYKQISNLRFKSGHEDWYELLDVVMIELEVSAFE